ncbi:MAG TPA: phosphoethanolamine transferase [Verrucomicrobiae bacterium]|nr:phosphoethanolamine transferase [Verrucomicrobiae bacterium]
MSLFCRYYYDAPVTSGVLESVEATRLREAWELMRLHPAWFAGTIVYLILVIWGFLTAHRVPSPFTNRCLIAGLLISFLALPVGVVLWLHGDPPSNFSPSAIYSKTKYLILWQCYPLDLVYSQYTLIVGRRAVEEARARRQSFVFPGVRRTTTSAGAEVYVVFIGESSRRASWSLFGYSRNTNPELSSLPPDEARGLFLFDNVRSNSNITLLSLPLTLTRATPDDLSPVRDEKSIVSLANQAGFDTYWISTQEKFGGFANSVTSMALEAHHVKFLASDLHHGGIFDGLGTGAYDQAILKPLSDAIAQNTGNPKKMIFLHTMGSHADYTARVPKDAEAFHLPPAPGVRFAAMGISRDRVDAYDDSILYTDFVVRQVIDTLAKLHFPTAFVYFSDHGERMDCPAFPNESFSHGFLPPTPDELNIPVFVWLSPDYMRLHPEAAAAAKSNEHFHTSLMALFDTIADLIRVDLDRTAPSQSLLISSPAPATLDILQVDGQVRLRNMPLASCGTSLLSKSQHGGS